MTEPESAVIGALLIDYAAWEGIEGLLTDEDFSEPIGQAIYRAIHELATTGQPFDVVTVAEQLQHNKQLELCGGLPAIGRRAPAKVYHWDGEA